MKDKQALIVMETSWLYSTNECELYSFLPFWCQLRSCPNIWSFNSSVYGEVLLKPGGILCAEVTQSGISTLPLLTIKSIMTLKWVLSQQLTLFTYLFIPINLEVSEESHVALGTRILRNRPSFQTLKKETKGEKCVSQRLPLDNDVVEKFSSLLAEWPHLESYIQWLNVWVESSNKWRTSRVCTETNTI